MAKSSTAEPFYYKLFSNLKIACIRLTPSCFSLPKVFGLKMNLDQSLTSEKWASWVLESRSGTLWLFPIFLHKHVGFLSTYFQLMNFSLPLLIIFKKSLRRDGGGGRNLERNLKIDRGRINYKDLQPFHGIKGKNWTYFFVYTWFRVLLSCNALPFALQKQ